MVGWSEFSIKTAHGQEDWHADIAKYRISLRAVDSLPEEADRRGVVALVEPVEILFQRHLLPWLAH